MLTFLFNRLNTYQDHAPREIAQCRLPFIGVSAEVPEFMRRRMAEAAPVRLYDSCLTVGDDFAEAIDVAVGLGAAQLMASVGRSCDAGRDERPFVEPVKRLREACAARGIELLLTNRRPFDPEVPVSAAKLGRLCAAAGVRLAFDVGASHASLRALEDFHDLRGVMAAMLLNDNLGREALCPVGHEDYIPGVVPDAMLQPGYGSAPFAALAEAARGVGIDLYINGQKHNHAVLGVVLLETNVLLAGKVPINPAGGYPGRWENGRLRI